MIVRDCSEHRGYQNKKDRFTFSGRHILVERDIRLLALAISGTKSTNQTSMPPFYIDVY